MSALPDVTSYWRRSKDPLALWLRELDEVGSYGVLAVTGLSGILGPQNDFPPPHHIYTINENKIEA